MKRFDIILVGLAVIILGLSFWIFMLYQNNDNSILEDLHKSKGRVEILERQLLEETVKSDSIAILRTEIQQLREAEPRERIIIVRKYDKELEDIDNQPVDSTLQSITDRLNNGRD
jgi:hypothetical protein